MIGQLAYGVLQITAFGSFYWLMVHSPFAGEDANPAGGALFGLAFAAIVTGIVYWSLEGLKALWRLAVGRDRRVVNAKHRQVGHRRSGNWLT